MDERVREQPMGDEHVQYYAGGVVAAAIIALVLLRIGLKGRAY